MGWRGRKDRSGLVWVRHVARPPPSPRTLPLPPARRRARHRRAERAPRQSPEGGRSLSGRQRDGLPHPSWVRNREEFSYLSMMSDSVVIALVGKLFWGAHFASGWVWEAPTQGPRAVKRLIWRGLERAFEQQWWRKQVVEPQMKHVGKILERSAVVKF